METPADSQALLELLHGLRCCDEGVVCRSTLSVETVATLLNAVECLVVERNIRKEFQHCTEQPELVVAITKTEEALHNLLNFR